MTTEERIKKAFDEIGDGISASTRELILMIPKMERTIKALEEMLGHVPPEDKDEDKGQAPHPKIESPVEMIEDWHSVNEVDEENDDSETDISEESDEEDL